MTRRALITGITGQDGSYLTELLLARDYEVHGVVRRASSLHTERIDHLYEDPHQPGARLFLHHGDLGDASSLQAIVARVRPDEVYNLGAQSHVRVSFDLPEYTGDVTGVGTLRLLEAIRKEGVACKFYQASSSEMFGQPRETPQRETTPLHPSSPYAAAKAYAYFMTQSYREAYRLFAVNGILFNHESPRRGETFVTRKITRAVGRIVHGLQQVLYLGNLEARRDWGHAREYVEAMWLMLQAATPADYVIGTGRCHSVRDVLDLAFGRAGLDWHDHVKQDPRYLRPAEVAELRADPARAERELGWRAVIGLPALIAEMVDADLELAARERRARG